MRLLIHDFAGYSFPAQLSRELASKGHEVVYVYSSGLPGPKGRLLRSNSDSERFRLHPIPLSRHFRKYSIVKRFITHRKYARKLKNLISRERPDAVLSGDTPIDIQAELVMHCRQRRVAFVHWVQDVYCHALEFFLRKKFPLLAMPLSVPFRLIEKVVAKQSDSVVVISSAFRNLLVNWGVPECKIAIRENWGPLDELRQVPRHNSWNRELKLEGLPIILYSGTLGYKHRPDLIYSLASAMKDECRIVVVSEGVGREYLERMPPLENLLLLNFQPYDRLPEVLATADALIATLETDAGQFAVPSKILTYLCAGRPLLFAGPKENLSASIIERSGAGLVVDPDDTQAWIEAARKLITNASYRAKLASNARQYAEEVFDIRKIANEFEQILAAACGDVPCSFQ